MLCIFLGGEFVGTIRVHTANEIIVFDNKPIITSGNKNINDISVTFCDKWLSLGENTEYWAVFFKDEKEIHKRKLENGHCLIPNAVMSKKGWFYFGFYSVAENGEKVKTSKIAEFEVTQGVPTEDTGESEIDIAVNSAKEKYRNELETSIETATGESQEGKTWEELNGTVAELPIITDEQTQALGDYDLIKDYFRDLAFELHQFFTASPTDENGKSRTFSLPYLYTPKFKWRANSQALNTNLIECGVDVTSAFCIGQRSGGTSSTFAPLPNLKKLVLTGNEMQSTLRAFMQSNTSLEYIKFETPAKSVLEVCANYYERAFEHCTKLRTIDCELDFTGQTSTNYMFNNCYLLENLRIKPFTLSTSLNLGSCRKLHNNGVYHYDNLISILNGITDDKEVAKNITLTFSEETGDFTTDMVTIWDCYVWWQDDGTYTLDEGNSIFAEPMSLYDAFITKGVTIAWK